MAMNEDIIIQVKNLTKTYRLYDSHSERVKETFHPFRKKYHRLFNALSNVAFDVRRGETLGVIGRNGSGKSSLLQILCGILMPTSGTVEVKGRVSALLELGAGFNPEFTGRQNVYLNALILGLNREETDKRFGDIAAFADIGEFIDQPVKLYSSGMYMRLAFSVQAFVPKDVMLIDETLAVGDEAFQRKCMAVLDQFRDGGGTILLVSHDSQTIIRHCNRCLLLAGGELIADGASKPVTDLYQRLMYSNPREYEDTLSSLKRHGLEYTLSQWQTEKDTDALMTDEDQENGNMESQSGSADWFDSNIPKTREVTYGSGHAKIIDCGMYNEHDEHVNVLIMGQRYKWIYRVRFYHDAYQVHFGMMLKTTDGLDVAGINTDNERKVYEYIPASSLMEVIFSIRLNVVPGTYFLNAGVMGVIEGQETYLHRRVDVEMIRVLPRDSRIWHGISYLEHKVTCITLS